eukprot:Awhi_evm1s1760
MVHKKPKLHIFCTTFPESRLDKQVQWDYLNKKSKCDLYQKIQLDDMVNAKPMKKGVVKMKWYVNKLTTSNRLKFKLANGTHGLRSELSHRNNESSNCVCRELDKEESVEHFFLECLLYNEIRDEVLLQIMYSSDSFEKEWFDGDEAHRCIMLLCDYDAFVSRSLITMEMAKTFCDIFNIGCQDPPIILVIMH